MGRFAVDALTGEFDLAAALDQAEDAFDGARLADAVAAEQSRDSGRRNLEADIFDDLLPGDLGAQTLHAQDGLTHRDSPR